MKKPLKLALLALLLLLSTPLLHADQILYVLDRQQQEVFSYNLDTSVKNTFESSSDFRSIDIDMETEKLYWQSLNGQTRQSDLDGMNTIDVGSKVTTDISIDNVNKKIYWFDLINDTLHRADLDGNNQETLIDIAANLSEPVQLVYNHDDLRVYWYDSTDKVIYSCADDGSDIRTVIGTGISNLSDLKVNLTTNQLIWSDFSNHAVNAALYDGTAQVTLASALFVRSVELDETNQILYYSYSSSPKIAKYNFSTTSSEDVAGLSLGSGLIQLAFFEEPEEVVVTPPPPSDTPGDDETPEDDNNDDETPEDDNNDDEAPIDNCPNDSNKVEPGVCGCGIAEVDDNFNEIIDCNYEAELEFRVHKLFKRIRTNRIANRFNTNRRKRLKKALSEVNDYVEVYGFDIILEDNSKNIKSIKKRINRSTKRLINSTSEDFWQKRGAAKRATRRLLRLL